MKADYKDYVSIGQLHDLLDDPKTNHMLLFEQIMEYLCENQDTKKYKKFLKEVGKWVDEAREGYGMRLVTKWE